MKRRRLRCSLRAVLAMGMLVLSMIVSVAPASGQKSGPMPKDISIVPHFGEKVPLDAAFFDERGKSVTLGDYFGERPVVMVLAYYECPMLCSMVLNGLMLGLRRTELSPGRDYEVIVLSIDPRDTPPRAKAKKASYMKLLRRPGGQDAIHFLTGSEPAIGRVAERLGFRYEYDPIGKQYAHAAGAIVITPNGSISRYFYGVDFAPNDLRLGIVDAADGKSGSLGDQLLLLCYRYDPEQGKYASVAMGSLRILGALTAVGLGLSLFLLHRRRAPSDKDVRKGR